MSARSIRSRRNATRRRLKWWLPTTDRATKRRRRRKPGAAIVTRRMGWDGYGPAEIAAVEARILATLNAALSRGDPP